MSEWVRKWGWLAYFHYVVLGGFAYQLVPAMHKGGLFAGISLLSAVTCFVGSTMATKEAKLPWLLFGIGQLSFATGDYLAYVRAYTHFPEIADVFYLATYPFMYLGFALLIERLHKQKNWVAAFGQMVGWGGATAALILALTLLSVGPSSAAVSIMYPILDAGMLMFMLMLRSDRDHTNHAAFYPLSGWSLLFLGIGSLALVDFLYSFQSLSSFYAPGGPLDIGWTIYYAALGATALAPHKERAFKVQEDEDG